MAVWPLAVDLTPAGVHAFLPYAVNTTRSSPSSTSLQTLIFPSKRYVSKNNQETKRIRQFIYKMTPLIIRSIKLQISNPFHNCSDKIFMFCLWLFDVRMVRRAWPWPMQYPSYLLPDPRKCWSITIILRLINCVMVLPRLLQWTLVSNLFTANLCVGRLMRISLYQEPYLH